MVEISPGTLLILEDHQRLRPVVRFWFASRSPGKYWVVAWPAFGHRRQPFPLLVHREMLAPAGILGGVASMPLWANGPVRRAWIHDFVPVPSPTPPGLQALLESLHLTSACTPEKEKIHP